MTEPIAVDTPLKSVLPKLHPAPTIPVVPTPAAAAGKVAEKPIAASAPAPAVAPAPLPAAIAPSLWERLTGKMSRKNVTIGASAIFSLAAGVATVRLMWPGEGADQATAQATQPLTGDAKVSTRPVVVTGEPPTTGQSIPSTKLPTEPAHTFTPIAPTEPTGTRPPPVIHPEPSAPTRPENGTWGGPSLPTPKIEPPLPLIPTVPAGNAGIVAPGVKPPDNTVAAAKPPEPSFDLIPPAPLNPPTISVLPAGGTEPPPPPSTGPAVTPLPAAPVLPSAPAAPTIPLPKPPDMTPNVAPPAAPMIPGFPAPPAAPMTEVKPPAVTPPAAPLVDTKPPAVTPPPAMIFPETKPPEPKLPEPKLTTPPVTPSPLPMTPVVGFPPGGLGTPPIPLVPPPPKGTGTGSPPPISVIPPPAPEFGPPTPVNPEHNPAGSPGAKLEFTKPPAAATVTPIASTEREPATSFDVDIFEMKPGTTWADVSREFYNDTKYAVGLQAYNRSHNVTGPSIEVPPIHIVKKYLPQSNSPASNSARNGTGGSSGNPDWGTSQPGPSASNEKTFRVPIGGMTMRAVARLTLGNEQRWKDIYDLNPAQKPDDRLPAGTDVKLPTDARLPN